MRTSPTRRPRSWLGVIGGSLVLALVTAACAGEAPSQASRTTGVPTPASSSEDPTTAEPARTARTAASERVRFRPEQVVLPGGATAVVVPARTVGGELRVPDDIRRVGWWDGSAYAGDPFGATVIAGHVDAPRQGLGYFERLLHIRPGATITLNGEGHAAAYRVVAVDAVFKDALSASSPAFDQRVGHRLVLLTCTGTFDRATRSYDQNLVVTATPLGAAL
ncbi:class F sortase [Terrabacter sp. MAHUQ-38]|uniref:class F sortase n=1 Tax=unclassified Terrabacter TaxID=2630222 RepID=UPI001CAA7354|nr:class F sortase [Terrabacter sp. MAHUQ-38]